MPSTEIMDEDSMLSSQVTDVWTMAGAPTLNYYSQIRLAKMGLWYNDLSRFIDKYGPPFLIAMGLLGNILSILTMGQPSMRTQRSSLLLIALAFADSMVLLTALLGDYIDFRFDPTMFNIRIIHPYLCKLSYWITGAAKHISGWTLVILTIERYIAISMPLRSKEILTRRRLIIIWCIMALILILLNAHFLYTANIRESFIMKYCRFSKPDDPWVIYFRYSIWMWIDLLVYTVIPFILIGSLNFLIVLHLARASRKRGMEMNVGSAKAQKALRSITVMLLSVTFCYLAFTSPYILFLLADNQGLIPFMLSVDGRRELIRNVTINLHYLNNAINFYLYFISGEHFRRALMEFLCLWRKRGGAKKTGASTSATASTSIPEKTSSFLEA